MFLTQLIVVYQDAGYGDYRLIPPLDTCTLVLSILSILVILNMPLRDQNLSADFISPVFSRPEFDLRSPEDNLKPWHFLTVEWMRPLIALGAKRQLNDEDVWGLAFEFQHKRLHERFRMLKGTVIRRLLSANGIDLVITSALGIIETAASKSYDILHWIPKLIVI